MTPRRVIAIAVTAAALYIGFSYWAITTFDIPPVRGWALWLVMGAALCQIGGQWFFGLLFRESVQEASKRLRRFSAFKAALVGGGVARLIPAGGAITPVAMSWTVRREVGATAGAAIRTVLLNYAGLLTMTGLGLLLARPVESAQIASISLVVLAPFVLAAGLLLMFGSGRLGTINRFLPRYFQKRLEASMMNHLPGYESQFYLWGRIALEAFGMWLVLTAFGIDISAFQVMAAYGVGQLAGGLPGTPGGLGLAEGALVFILIAYGFSLSAVIAPIIVFRVVSYWLPAGLGFLAGGSTFLRSEEAQATDTPAGATVSLGEMTDTISSPADTVSFRLANQDGEVVRDSDLRGHKYVLFFYPKALTSGCTIESCDFRDSHQEFVNAGYQVVGVSPDPPELNRKFKEKESLTFDLLSDEDHSLALSLGAWGEKKVRGEVRQGIIRSTFVVDEEGRLVEAYRNVRAEGHVDRLKEDLLG